MLIQKDLELMLSPNQTRTIDILVMEKRRFIMDFTAAFSSEANLRDAYATTLESFLPIIRKENDLMLLNTLTANIHFDDKLYKVLSLGFRTVFGEMESAYRSSIRNGQSIGGSEDDLNVFLRMALVGTTGIQKAERKKVGPWLTQFNHVRYFRPRRSAGKPASGPLMVPFNPRGFHYGLPAVNPEVVASGKLGGMETDLVINQYPFFRLHGLLVPERGSHHPQFLDREKHYWAWRVFASLEHLSGVGGGYNSLKSFASVNHFHIQMFVEPEGLPITDSVWQHNGGSIPYPASVVAFSNPDRAWEWIDQANRADKPYNLLYTPERMFCFARIDQGTYDQPYWTSGLACSEMCGSFITFNMEDYNNLTEGDYTEALRSVPS